MAAKVSKQSVNYRPSTSPDKRCGTCVMFRPASVPIPSGHPRTGTCTLVAGLIEAPMVCDRWEKK